MSADNGIYILRTLKGDDFEYRVAHLQGIENLEWDEVGGGYTDNQDVHIKNARRMWSDCEVFAHETEALAFALKMEKCLDILEYGISSIDIDREFDPSAPAPPKTHVSKEVEQMRMLREAEKDFRRIAVMAIDRANQIARLIKE